MKQHKYIITHKNGDTSTYYLGTRYSAIILAAARGMNAWGSNIFSIEDEKGDVYLVKDINISFK